MAAGAGGAGHGAPAVAPLAQLSEQYWELKYEHGELKARVKALAPTPEEQAAAQPPVQQTFVPLTSIKTQVTQSA